MCTVHARLHSTKVRVIFLFIEIGFLIDISYVQNEKITWRILCELFLNAFLMRVHIIITCVKKK